MGLDTYAIYGKEHPKYNLEPGALNSIPDELFPENHLCGGMFSGHGNSFRGKVYDSWVEFVTGISLYEEMIPPEDVKNMACLMDDVTELTWDKFNDLDLNHYGITYEQTKELAEWFSVVANEGGSIYGWW